MISVQNLETRPDGEKHYVVFNIERHGSRIYFERVCDESGSYEMLTPLKARQIARALLAVSTGIKRDANAIGSREARLHRLKALMPAYSAREAAKCLDFIYLMGLDGCDFDDMGDDEIEEFIKDWRETCQA